MNKKLTRSLSDKMVSGVCSGMAKYLNMDVTVVRLVYSILTAVTGFGLGIIIYIVALFIMPEGE